MATSLTREQTQQLAREGFTLLRGLLPSVVSLRAHLDTLWAAEGDAAGAENYMESNVRRLANLVNKGGIFRPIFGHPLVLDAVRYVLGPDIRLSMLNAREVPASQPQRQPFHRDTDGCGHSQMQGFFSCTAIWMLDDFNPSNGAPRIIAGSHHAEKLPDEKPEGVHLPHPQEKILVGSRGDVIVMNGHCRHAGGANESAEPRLAILAHYYRAGVRRPDNRRQHLSAHVIAGLSPSELALLGLNEP